MVATRNATDLLGCVDDGMHGDAGGSGGRNVADCSGLGISARFPSPGLGAHPPALTQTQRGGTTDRRRFRPFDEGSTARLAKNPNDRGRTGETLWRNSVRVYLSGHLKAREVKGSQTRSAYTGDTEARHSPSGASDQLLESAPSSISGAGGHLTRAWRRKGPRLCATKFWICRGQALTNACSEVVQRLLRICRHNCASISLGHVEATDCPPQCVG